MCREERLVVACAWWLEQGGRKIPEQPPRWAPCQQGRENKQWKLCLPVARVLGLAPVYWPLCPGPGLATAMTEMVKGSETDRDRKMVTEREMVSQRPRQRGSE